MTVQQTHYEELLAEYSDPMGILALLKQYRPYLETVPSLRRPQESLISIPLPVARIRAAEAASPLEAVRLPCEVAVLMCDPEWKIKTGGEIFVFIHRPREEFSELLARWRQIQVWLDRGHEWMMPPRYQHILSEGSEKTHPLFVIFPDTPERIRRGLRGARLPFVIETVQTLEEDLSETLAASEPEDLPRSSG